MKPKYVVIVGNIGTVYSGNNRTNANQIWEAYVAQSHSGKGRAGGEYVVLCDGKTGDPIREYEGADGE